MRGNAAQEKMDSLQPGGNPQGCKDVTLLVDALEFRPPVAR